MSIEADWLPNRFSQVNVAIPDELMHYASGLLGRQGTDEFISPSGEIIQTCNSITNNKTYTFGYSWLVNSGMASTCNLNICPAPAEPLDAPPVPPTQAANDACAGLTGAALDACLYDYAVLNDTKAAQPTQSVSSSINLSNVTININAIVQVWMCYSDFLQIF